MPPFIATLGMMVIAFGITAIYFDQPPNSSQPISGIRADLSYLGTGALALGPLSIPIIVAVAGTAAVLMWVLLEKTVFGKNVYAVGGNPQAAQVSGVNIVRTLIAVYAIAGACYGVAGVLEAARTGGASSRYGELYELDAIAACVVGGVSTAGGIGRVRGIVAGVLVFSVISYGLTFIGINPFWQQIDQGRDHHRRGRLRHGPEPLAPLARAPEPTRRPSGRILHAAAAAFGQEVCCTEILETADPADSTLDLYCAGVVGQRPSRLRPATSSSGRGPAMPADLVPVPPNEMFR